MNNATPPPPPLDPGAAALAFILQLLGLPANAAELVHQSGRTRLDETDLMRIGRRFPVKIRAIDTTMERLGKTPTPFLARARDGRWWIVGRIGDDKVLLQDPV